MSTYVYILAIAALQLYRRRDNVDGDIQEMRIEQQQKNSEPEWTFMELLQCKDLRMPLILGCSLNAAQQLSGVNIVSVF